MNGSAAIHDFELALAGKTSEDVGAPAARPASSAWPARRPTPSPSPPAHGAENDLGLGAALGQLHRRARLPARRQQPGAGRLPRRHPLHGPRRPRHRHRPHAPARLRGGPGRGVADRLPPPVQRRRRRWQHGVWLNLGSAVMLPEVFLKAVSVVRNFGHNLDGLVTVNLDKESRTAARVNVLDRPVGGGHRADRPSRDAAAAAARGGRLQAGAAPAAASRQQAA